MICGNFTWSGQTTCNEGPLTDHSQCYSSSILTGMCTCRRLLHLLKLTSNTLLISFPDLEHSEPGCRLGYELNAQELLLELEFLSTGHK